MDLFARLLKNRFVTVSLMNKVAANIEFIFAWQTFKNAENLLIVRIEQFLEESVRRLNRKFLK